MVGGYSPNFGKARVTKTGLGRYRVGALLATDVHPWQKVDPEGEVNATNKHCLACTQSDICNSKLKVA